jgi:hypothetical protein
MQPHNLIHASIVTLPANCYNQHAPRPDKHKSHWVELRVELTSESDPFELKPQIKTHQGCRSQHRW